MKIHEAIEREEDTLGLTISKLHEIAHKLTQLGVKQVGLMVVPVSDDSRQNNFDQSEEGAELLDMYASEISLLACQLRSYARSNRQSAKRLKNLKQLLDT